LFEAWSTDFVTEKRVGQPLPSSGQQAVGAAMAAALGLSVHQHIGAGAAELLTALTAPGAITLTGRVADEWLAGRLGRRAAAYETASEQSGLSHEEIGSVVRSAPGLLTLAGSIGADAEDARYQAKVEALGRALAAALSDPTPATIDQQFLRAAAIADLEPPHVKLLHFIAYPPGAGGDYAGGLMLLDEVVGPALPDVRPILRQLQATLSRHYLIRQEPSDPTGRYEPYTMITSFGHEILELLGQDQRRARTMPLL
jgi:hypothetical protein